MEGDYSSAAINTGSGAVPAPCCSGRRGEVGAACQHSDTSPLQAALSSHCQNWGWGVAPTSARSPQGAPHSPTAANCCHWTQQGFHIVFKSSSILLFWRKLRCNCKTSTWEVPAMGCGGIDVTRGAWHSGSLAVHQGVAF